MTAYPLKDWIKPRLRHSRSVNVERHLTSYDIVDGYIPTGRAIEAIDRIATALETPAAPRAWTITGPYGSGKSAYAAFLAALLGASDDPRHVRAMAILDEVAPDLTNRLRRIRATVGANETGFIVALGTAQREPVTTTIARALLNGARLRWSGRGRKPAFFKELIDLAADPRADATRVIAVTEDIMQRGPLLLILDEFGKNLEYAADDPSVGDLFIIQQVAELLAGEDAPTGVFVTFQHLSFTDYAHGLPAARLQEWNKVQGRFEDLSFLEAHDQTAQLIRAAVTISPPTPEVGEQIDGWARTAARIITDLGLDEIVPAAPDLIAEIYPLHPLVLAALPELTARYGQYERSLFNFLTADEPHALRSFLKRSVLDHQTVPILTLDELYDFFIGAAADVPTMTVNASRWIEIRTRIREAQSLDPGSLAVLKAIGVLNLISSGGPLRASWGALTFATVATGDLAETLQSLQDRGLLTYRGFADEYRVWEGSDVDLADLTAREREQAQAEDLATHLARALPPQQRIAQRHSLRTGTLRFLEGRYLSDRSDFEDQDTPADGLIVYLLGDVDPTELPTATRSGRPVVYAVTSEYLRIEDAAVEAAALTSLLTASDEVRADRVALQETRHRAGVAQETLRRRLETAFDPTRSSVTWVADGAVHPVDGPKALASLLSDLMDRTYIKAPVLRNEMLNREQLTSQGAKARRVLLERMIEHADEPLLGIEGYGPERAMYESVLHDPGIHQGQADRWGFRPPGRGNTYRDAWAWIVRQLQDHSDPVSLGDLQEALQQPPFGMRRGPIPVLFVAILATHADELAIYQEGSFEPVLTPDLAERIIKIPGRFTVRHTHTSGARSSVIDALKAALEIPQFSSSGLRNATLLSVIRPMVAELRRVPDFGMRTESISVSAQRVRKVLLTVREPDELVFSTLPEAVGMEPFAAGEHVEEATARRFAARVTDGLLEIVRAYPAMLENVTGELARAFGVGPGAEMREDLRARSRHLADQVLDQRLRSFLLFAINEELGDTEWLEALAMNLTGKPPKTWLDSDVTIFKIRLAELMATFRRVELLYYERLERGAQEGFTAQRLTLTLPDGEEAARVIWLDDSQREAVVDLVEHIVDLTDNRLGETARAAVLAGLAQYVLGERPVPEVTDDEDEVSEAHDGG